MHRIHVDINKLREKLEIGEKKLGIIDRDHAEQKPKNNSYALIYETSEKEWKFYFITPEGRMDEVSFIKAHSDIKQKLANTSKAADIRQNDDVMEFFQDLANEHMAHRSLFVIEFLTNKIIEDLEKYLGRNKQQLKDPATQLLRKAKTHKELLTNALDAGASEFVIEIHRIENRIHYEIYDVGGTGFAKKFLKGRVAMAGSELFPKLDSRYVSKKSSSELGGRGRGLQGIVNNARKKGIGVVLGNKTNFRGETTGSIIIIETEMKSNFKPTEHDSEKLKKTVKKKSPRKFFKEVKETPRDSSGDKFTLLLPNIGKKTPRGTPRS